MSNFVKDTIEINNNINLDVTNTVKEGTLKAVVLPHYIDPDSNEMVVILKRSLLPGAFAITGKKMGITTLTVELPQDKPITVEEVVESFNLNFKVQNIVPFGSVMPDPENTSDGFELVLVHVEPVEFLNKERGIIYQKKGEYEIGTVKFGDLVEAINENMILDLKTRLILNELYTLMIEEGMRQAQGNGQPPPGNVMPGEQGMIGGGRNLPPGFNEREDTVVTTDIPDEVLEENSQTDFGAIYAHPGTSGFTSVEKPT